MKGKNLIMMIIMLVVLSLSVNAIAFTQGTEDFRTLEGENCLVQNETDCVSWISYFTLDYRDDSSYFKRLSREPTLPSETTQGNYRLYLEYRLYDGTAGKFNSRTTNASIYCDVTCHDVNCEGRILLNETFTESDETDTEYFEIKLKNSEYLYCELVTNYLSNDLALSSNRFNYRVWQPTYESESSEPDRRTIINLEADVEELNERITDEYKTTMDYIMGVIKSVVKLNFNLWVYAYWVVLIGLVVGIFSLLFYILFWVSKRFKKL